MNTIFTLVVLLVFLASVRCKHHKQTNIYDDGSADENQQHTVKHRGHHHKGSKRFFGSMLNNLFGGGNLGNLAKTAGKIINGLGAGGGGSAGAANLAKMAGQVINGLGGGGGDGGANLAKIAGDVINGLGGGGGGGGDGGAKLAEMAGQVINSLGGGGDGGANLAKMAGNVINSLGAGAGAANDGGVNLNALNGLNGGAGNGASAPPGISAPSVTNTGGGNNEADVIEVVKEVGKVAQTVNEVETGMENLKEKERLGEKYVMEIYDRIDKAFEELKELKAFIEGSCQRKRKPPSRNGRYRPRFRYGPSYG